MAFAARVSVAVVHEVLEEDVNVNRGDTAGPVVGNVWAAVGVPEKDVQGVMSVQSLRRWQAVEFSVNVFRRDVVELFQPEAVAR